MIGQTRAIRVWAWPAPVDLRKGFNGLAGLVTGQPGLELMSGDYFLFVNASRTTAKVLLWDGTGICIYQKRLAKSRFARLWTSPGSQELRMTTTELGLFLDGAKLTGMLPLSPRELYKTGVA
jgi:transposase